MNPKILKGFSFFLFIVLCFIGYRSTAQISPHGEGPITIMEFEREEYDFGIIEEGTMVRQVYTFTNIGTEPLILINVKGSCGCTVPQWPRDPIAPGETASLTVEFNSKGKRGKRKQRVTITANTNPSQTYLYLKGEIKPKEESGDDLAIIQSETEEKPNCLNVYPNPTSDVLRMEMEKNALGLSAIISIHSYKGELMAARNIDEVKPILEFDVRHYPAGSYTITIQVEGQTAETRCFVVAK